MEKDVGDQGVEEEGVGVVIKSSMFGEVEVGDIIVWQEDRWGKVV